MDKYFIGALFIIFGVLYLSRSFIDAAVGFSLKISGIKGEITDWGYLLRHAWGIVIILLGISIIIFAK